MKNLNGLLALLVLGLLSACSKNSDTSVGGSSDQSYNSSRASSGSENSASATQPDNTGRNVRDRNDATLTPGDQGGSESDREVTRRIRKALNANKQLTTDAQNVKIITTDGKVTLRGPVNGEEEKSTIASLAQQNGATSVDNQLEVTSNTQKPNNNNQ